MHEQECEFWHDRGWLPLHQVTALQKAPDVSEPQLLHQQCGARTQPIRFGG